jgi:hypothetical protein
LNVELPSDCFFEKAGRTPSSPWTGAVYRQWLPAHKRFGPRIFFVPHFLFEPAIDKRWGTKNASAEMSENFVDGPLIRT